MRYSTILIFNNDEIYYAKLTVILNKLRGNKCHNYINIIMTMNFIYIIKS